MEKIKGILDSIINGDSKTRLVVTSLFSIVLVSVLLLGSTYSLFTTSSVDEDLNVYKTGNLDITYTLSSENIKLNDSTPISDDESNVFLNISLSSIYISFSFSNFTSSFVGWILTSILAGFIVSCIKHIECLFIGIIPL